MTETPLHPDAHFSIRSNAIVLVSGETETTILHLDSFIARWVVSSSFTHLEWLIKSAAAFHKIPVKDVRFATDRPDLEKKLP